MSDLSALLGGAPGDGQTTTGGETAAPETTNPKPKPKQTHPKPQWVLRREQVTGMTYEFDEQKRSWQPAMEAPQGAQAGGDLSAATDKFISGDYKGTMDILTKLQANQAVSGTDQYKKLRQRTQEMLGTGQGTGQGA